MLFRSGLECPMDRISGFVFDIINATDFKEFYLTDASTMGEDGVNAMLAYLSDYDWQKGRYAGGDNKAAYRKHLLSAMGRVIEHLSATGELSGTDQSTERVTRNAFRNSLCTHSVKCKLEIEYVPCGKAEHLRASVTSAIKYTENRLRAALGVKSRLSVIALPDEYKRLIDGYFDSIYERVNKERIKASIPEYEKLYDTEHTEMSIDGADEIERASWTTTARLIAEDEPEFEAPVVSEPINAPMETEDEPLTGDSYGLTASEIAFLRAVSDNDADALKNICEDIGSEALTVAERINEAFSDGFGDVVIEGDADGLNIIEDYEEEIKEWLMKRMR